TNVSQGVADATFDLPPSSYKTFVVSLTLSGELISQEVGLTVACDDGAASATKTGLNSLMLSVSPTPVPDVIAIAATPSNDGVLRVATGSPGAFSAAVVNVGATAGLAAFVSDTSGLLPFDRLTICQTQSAKGGQCLATPAPGGILLTLAQDEVA